MIEMTWKVKVRIRCNGALRTEVFFNPAVDEDAMLKIFGMALKTAVKREGWEVLRITAERLPSAEEADEAASEKARKKRKR